MKHSNIQVIQKKHGEMPNRINMYWLIEPTERHGGISLGASEKDAKHIVKCVNNYDALVEALQRCHDFIEKHAGGGEVDFREPIQKLLKQIGEE